MATRTDGTVDFYLLDELLTEDEIEIRDRLRAFCAREVTPVASRYWEAAEFPFELIPKMAGLNLAGGSIEGYGCPGMSSIATGLVAQEWARSDGSIGTFFGVHSFLAMQTIGMLGSEEQRERWLPEMARIELIGAFALTEPEHGSDSIALETTARRDGDEYVLNGRKKWIGNASFADLVIVWARGEDGHVGGYVVEKGTPGYHAEVITGKTALRSSWQAEIELHDVRVPAENRLAGCHDFKDVGRVLTSTRYAVAWRALGLAMAAYELARDRAAGGRRHRAGAAHRARPGRCARARAGRRAPVRRGAARAAGDGHARDRRRDPLHRGHPQRRLDALPVGRAVRLLRLRAARGVGARRPDRRGPTRWPSCWTHPPSRPSRTGRRPSSRWPSPARSSACSRRAWTRACCA